MKKVRYTMKKLFFIGGTMRVGKTTICQNLKKRLPNSVYLDGDWCWNANPFKVTDETKKNGHRQYLLCIK